MNHLFLLFFFRNRFKFSLLSVNLVFKICKLSSAAVTGTSAIPISLNFLLVIAAASFALPSSKILVALHTIHLNEIVAFRFISGGGSRIF